MGYFQRHPQLYFIAGSVGFQGTSEVGKSTSSLSSLVGISSLSSLVGAFSLFNLVGTSSSSNLIL